MAVKDFLSKYRNEIIIGVEFLVILGLSIALGITVEGFSDEKRITRRK